MFLVTACGKPLMTLNVERKCGLYFAAMNIITCSRIANAETAQVVTSLLYWGPLMLTLLTLWRMHNATRARGWPTVEREPRKRSVSHQAAQRADFDRFNKNRLGITWSRSKEPCFESTFDSTVHYLLVLCRGEPDLAIYWALGICCPVASISI